MKNVFTVSTVYLLTSKQNRKRYDWIWKCLSVSINYAYWARTRHLMISCFFQLSRPGCFKTKYYILWAITNNKINVIVSKIPEKHQNLLISAFSMLYFAGSQQYLTDRSIPNEYYYSIDYFWCKFIKFCRPFFQLNFFLMIPHPKSQFRQNSIFQSKNETFY